MKKFFLMTLAAFMLVSCDKEEAILTDELPANVLGFVEAHYDGKTILHVVKELDNLKTYYHVYLDNGTKLDFNRHGSIMKIEGHEKIPDNPSVFCLQCSRRQLARYRCAGNGNHYDYGIRRQPVRRLWPAAGCGMGQPA